MNKIVILDAGSQYLKLIDRKIRELNICSEFKPIDTKLSDLKNYRGIIISGGPDSVYSEGALKCDPDILNQDEHDFIPVFGICYGMQLINFMTGGTVEKKETREDGQEIIDIDTNSKIFTGLSNEEKVLLTHGDSLSQISNDYNIIGISKSSGIISGIQHKTLPIYGLQFHPEVDLTEKGKDIFRNFLFNICNLSPDFTLDNRTDMIINEIKEKVGNKKVLVLLSGGVDSTVCGALLYKALSENKVIGLHVNTGFMREQESEYVKEALEKIGFSIKVIDAEDRFLNGTTIINDKETQKLCETVEPEIKRKIIGDTFMKIIDEEIKNLGFEENEYFIAQGTLRPDLIESASAIASSKAAGIKTHHNDTELVRKKRELGLIIEPLKDYHKDEVRELGLKLGLPEHLVFRHPFPGPGLAIRILCNNDNYNYNNDYNYNQNEIKIINTKLKDFETENIKLCLLPIKSVGIQGDCRTYSYVVGIYNFNSYYETNWDELFQLAKEIPKKIHGVNRIVYIINNKNVKSKKVVNIEIQKIPIIPTLLNKETTQILRNVDFTVNSILQKHNFMSKFSQVPIILLPIAFDAFDSNNRSIVIRTFLTNDFMTGLPAIPDRDFPSEILDEINEEIINNNPISKVLYDLTGKPPATTEWE